MCFIGPYCPAGYFCGGGLFFFEPFRTSTLTLSPRSQNFQCRWCFSVLPNLGHPSFVALFILVNAQGSVPDYPLESFCFSFPFTLASCLPLVFLFLISFLKRVHFLERCPLLLFTGGRRLFNSPHNWPVWAVCTRHSAQWRASDWRSVALPDVGFLVIL